MPDDGGAIERALFSEKWTDQLLRKEKGLPEHYKCDCDQCAAWRFANWSRIESLDWSNTPTLKNRVDVLEEKINVLKGEVLVKKPQHNTVLTDVSQSLLRALEAVQFMEDLQASFQEGLPNLVRRGGNQGRVH